jgi:sugar/nucleoside kinase (ribokinase family)
MLPDRGANDALAPGDLPDDAFAPGRHLHLSGYTLLHPGSRPAGLAAMERARGAGMRVSIDPASAAPLLACGPRAVLGWLQGADVLLPNRDEATALTGEADPRRAAAALAEHAAEVVVTLGAQGALWTDGTVAIAADAHAAAVVDSTGAGDAFAAGWIAARRAGAEPLEALTAGCVNGARAVGRRGARPA